MTALQRKAAAALVLPFLIAGITTNAAKPAAWRSVSGWSYAIESIPGGILFSITGSVDTPQAILGSVAVTPIVFGRVDAPQGALGSVSGTATVSGSVDAESIEGSA